MEDGQRSAARLAALDGLRGVAAICVVLFHLKIPALSRGYLSVDFFFMLSGFVIARAYETKLAGSLSFWSFTARRLKRLYPLMLLGTALGLLAAILTHSGEATPIALLAQLSWLPLVATADAFPLNSVQWSLSVEIVANLAHAVLLRRLGVLALAAISAVSLAILIPLAARTQLSGGWTLSDFWVGFARAGLAYPLGVVLYRLSAAGRLPTIHAPFWLIGGAYVLALAVVSRFPSGLADLAFVLAVCPTVIVLGLSVRSGAIETRGMEMLGAASFPLYAIHYPLLSIWQATIGAVPHISLLFVVVAVALALLANYRIDAPVQRRLAAS